MCGRMDKTKNCIISIEGSFNAAPAKVHAADICIPYEGPPVRSASDRSLIALCSLKSVPNLSLLHPHGKKKGRDRERRMLETRRVQPVSVRIMSDQG